MRKKLLGALLLLSVSLYGKTYKSEEGRNIPTYKFGKSGEKILIIGGVHGNEPESLTLTKGILNILNNKNLKLKHEVMVMPNANPDARVKNTRANSNGIDINRNFPTRNFGQKAYKKSHFGGTKASSERETKNLMAVMKDFKPDLVVTIHAPYDFMEIDGPAKKPAKFLAKYNKMPVKEGMGYPTPGSFGTYYGKERKIPIITYELKNGETKYKRHLESFKRLFESTSWI